MKIDLHLHSNYSDGKFKPAEVARRLASAGIKIASLTDHDTVDGMEEFNRTAKKLGISTINGVEITAYQDGIGLHILGLGINVKNSRLNHLFLKQAKARKQSFLKAVELFQKAGFKIDQKQFKKLEKLSSVTKAHIFNLIYGVGSNKKLAKSRYNFQEGERVMSSFIDQFMSLPGQIAYVRKNRISGREAIKTIHQAGGWAVLAHPGIEIEFRQGKSTILEIIKKLQSAGLDGLEVFSCAFHQGELVQFYDLAKKYQLIPTIGSDDHDGLRIGTVKVSPKIEKEIIKIWREKTP